MTIAASACLAILPVSIVSCLPPISTLSLMYMGSPLWRPGGENESFNAGSDLRIHHWRADSAPPSRAARNGLLTDAERVDETAIPVERLLLQVVQQAAALADQLEQTPARVVILRVVLEVLGQVVDALGQERDLDF